MGWLGRRVLGDEIFLRVQCMNSSKQPAAPDAAPTVSIYNESGTRILTKSIPPLERYSTTGFFGYMQQLNSLFAVGRYAVYYSYTVSATQGDPGDDNFEVMGGGNTAGQVISMMYLDRPDSDFILAQLDSGATSINRGPHI